MELVPIGPLEWRADDQLQQGERRTRRVHGAVDPRRTAAQLDVATFIAWTGAYAANNTTLSDFYFKRFRAEFKPAVDAWVATKPLKNRAAPLTPFTMPQYQLAELHPSVVPLPRIGSLALRLARVAHGQIDVAIVGGNSHDWDLAAADLFVHKASSALTNINGERLTFNRAQPVHELLVAASGSRHSMALELVRERRAQFA